MSDIFNEVFGGTDTSKLTPIEIALGIDSEGRTTAKKLYEFLELDPSHYAKWFRRNVMENSFAEENVDYWVFAPKSENLSGGRPTQDAKLTAHFAKKLSMVQKNQKGDAARTYFVGVENGAKNLISQYKALSPTERPGEVANLIKVIARIMEKQGSAPCKVTENAQLICAQYGITLSSDFVKVPEYEQMKLDNFMG
nr:antA/AntB antirepressor family protein [uncultured Lachnoclostridium sp.]